MLNDNAFTHIICGYSAAASIRSAFNIKPENIVKCGDLIAVGQQNLHHEYLLWEKDRMPALDAALDADLFDKAENGKSFKLFQNFNALDAGKPVLIWLDSGVASQLVAAFCCYLFARNSWDLNRLHTLAYPKADIFSMGMLGTLFDDTLRDRRPELRKLPRHDIDLYTKIWTDFAGPELQKSLGTICGKSEANLTMGAMPYLRRRLPSRLNGLNEIDHDLLKHAVAEAPKAISAIALALGHDESPEMGGDLYLFARLNRFGSSELKHPLIEIDNPTGQMRESQIRILPLAHEILAGRANMIELNGLDDWLGGVHLTPDNLIWREDLEVPAKMSHP